MSNETSICVRCHMEIELRETTGWTANAGILEEYSYADDVPEPWFDACPGSPKVLEAYPYYSQWADSASPSPARNYQSHDPMPKLMLAAREALGYV